MDRNEEESAAWILLEVSDDALRVRLQWQPADRPSPSLYLPEAEDALCMVAGSDGCNWNRTLSPSPRWLHGWRTLAPASVSTSSIMCIWFLKHRNQWIGCCWRANSSKLRSSRTLAFIIRGIPLFSNNVHQLFTWTTRHYWASVPIARSPSMLFDENLDPVAYKLEDFWSVALLTKHMAWCSLSNLNYLMPSLLEQGQMFLHHLICVHSFCHLFLLHNFY
jgi:hypothetical protein